MKKIVCLLICFLGMPAVITLASVGGQTLQKNLSPRAEAVGMAYTALVDDVYALYANPAALSYMRYSEVAGAYSTGLSDDYLTHMSYANAANQFYTWGIGVLYYSSGSFEYIDADGQSRSYPSVKEDWLVIFGQAYRYNPWWRFGFNFEVFHSTLLEEYHATTIAMSLANSIQFNNDFRMDMVLKHLGLPLSYGEKDDLLGIPMGAEPREALPITFQLGLAYDILGIFNEIGHELILAVEIDKTLLEPYRSQIGMEYTFLERYSLRAGYQFNHENKGLSFGAGLIQPVNSAAGLKLDYSFSFSEFLRDQHKISLSYVHQMTDLRKNGADVLPIKIDEGYDETLLKIGFGVGRDFGGVGVNVEGKISDTSGLFIGLGSVEPLVEGSYNTPPKICVGARAYLGTSQNSFRGVAGFSISNGIYIQETYYNHVEVDTYPEFSGAFGLEWRMFERLSLDLSAGVGIGFLSTNNTSMIIISPAINAGLVFHIPKP